MPIRGQIIRKRFCDSEHLSICHVYINSLEAMAKMKTLKERSSKDETTFQAEMKILQRMLAHDDKLKEFMTTKENERLDYKAEEAEKRAKMSELSTHSPRIVLFK